MAIGESYYFQAEVLNVYSSIWTFNMQASHILMNEKLISWRYYNTLVSVIMTDLVTTNTVLLCILSSGEVRLAYMFPTMYVQANVSNFNV